MNPDATGAPASARADAGHVLLVTHHYRPERGVPQRRWDALVPRLQAAGYRISVLAPPPHYPSGTFAPEHAHLRSGVVQTGEHGETVYRVAFREHSATLASRTLDYAVAAAGSVLVGARRLGGRGRPTVVIGTVPAIPSMFAAWVLARLFRAKFVVEMRDAWPDLIAPAGVVTSRRSGPKAAIVKTVHGAIIRLQSRADLVVTTTETFADVVLERGARRVGVVRNGTEFTTQVPEQVAEELQESAPDERGFCPRRPLRVVYVGNVGASQGLDNAVKACVRMARLGLPVDLQIAGIGTHLHALQRLADQFDAPVTFLGRVPHEKVAALYATADTVLVPLRDWAPFRWTVPSKLYEVMASGRHVTGVLTGEAAELIRTLGAGATVEPGDIDALVDLWRGFIESDAELSGSAAAQAWVATHADDDALAERYVELLDGLRR